MRSIATLFFVFIFAGFSIAGTAPASRPSLNMDELERRGDASRAAFGSVPTSWVVSNVLGSGAELRMSSVLSGDKQRIIVEVFAGGHKAEALRIISRDGLWYVTDPKGTYKYRPYEFPTETPFIYLALQRLSPAYISPSAALDGGKLISVDNGIATFSQPLPDEQVKQFRGVLDQINALPTQTGKPLTPDLQRLVPLLSDIVENGLSQRVNIKTGQIIEFGAPAMRTRVVEFNTAAPVDEAIFAVTGHPWQDFSDDPTKGDLNDLLMISNAPRTKAGEKNSDPDGRLMDVKTGRFRRIPFKGGAISGACFLKNRQFLVINGIAAEGRLKPYLIDLKTGDNRELETPPGFGTTLFGDVSPDGKTLATVYVQAGKQIVGGAQIALIDLATGKARTIGEPLDTAGPRWTADGKHLLITHRESKSLNSVAIESPALMDMDGKVTVLRLGAHPCLLGDRKTILFQDSNSRLWHTCDLEGKNDKLFADGLKGFSFPAPAPDGKRIVMMRFTIGKLPEPVLLNIGESQGRVITTAPGLWAMPAWQ